MAVLARRLRSRGFTPVVFDYRPGSSRLADHARDLGAFMRHQDADAHLLGHSLGGLLILRMLRDEGDSIGRRIVLLGSPLNGSQVVARARRLPGAVRLLGNVAQDLETGFGTIAPAATVGMIAGCRSLGLGRLLGSMVGPGDGTVAVAETRADGLTDHLVLPVSHSGLLYSRQVAAAAANFLRHGRFAMSS